MTQNTQFPPLNSSKSWEFSHFSKITAVSRDLTDKFLQKMKYITLFEPPAVKLPDLEAPAEAFGCSTCKKTPPRRPAKPPTCKTWKCTE